MTGGSIFFKVPQVKHHIKTLCLSYIFSQCFVFCINKINTLKTSVNFSLLTANMSEPDKLKIFLNVSWSILTHFVYKHSCKCCFLFFFCSLSRHFHLHHVYSLGFCIFIYFLLLSSVYTKIMHNISRLRKEKVNLSLIYI